MVELRAFPRLDLQLVEDAQALVRQLEVIVFGLSVQYSTVQFVQFSTLYYSIVQHSAVLCSFVQYSTVQYSIV